MFRRHALQGADEPEEGGEGVGMGGGMMAVLHVSLTRRRRALQVEALALAVFGRLHPRDARPRRRSCVLTALLPRALRSLP